MTSISRFLFSNISDSLLKQELPDKNDTCLFYLSLHMFVSLSLYLPLFLSIFLSSLSLKTGEFKFLLFVPLTSLSLSHVLSFFPPHSLNLSVCLPLPETGKLTQMVDLVLCFLSTVFVNHPHTLYLFVLISQSLSLFTPTLPENW